MSKITLSRNDFQAFWPASIRYYELDPQGVVHNARYVSFFDEAITSYFKYVNYDYWSDIVETKKDLCKYPKVSALTLAPSMCSETIFVNVSPSAPEPDNWIFP